MRRVAAGEHGPLWIRADRQTAGRGRSGRSWASQSGDLLATFALSPGCGPERLPELSLLTGVALFDAIVPMLECAKAVAHGPVRLKWPNDLVAGSAKLAGILIESTISGGESVAAIGIGVNVTSAPRIEGRDTAALADWIVPPAPRELLVEIDVQMRRWLDAWQRGARFDLVRGAWLERAHAPGEPVSVNNGAELVCGAFAGIDETGALLIDNVPGRSNGVRRFTFGDVSLMPR